MVSPEEFKRISAEFFAQEDDLLAKDRIDLVNLCSGVSIESAKAVFSELVRLRFYNPQGFFIGSRIVEE